MQPRRAHKLKRPQSQIPHLLALCLCTYYFRSQLFQCRLHLPSGRGRRYCRCRPGFFLWGPHATRCRHTGVQGRQYLRRNRFLLLRWILDGSRFYTSAYNSILTSLVAAKALSQGVGVFLLGWTIFTALMFIGTLRLNLALIVTFGLLTLTFLALTIGWLAGVGTATFTTWVGIGGWLGILTAIAAWYTALAGVLSSVKLVNLPTMPRD